ncbi:hypothetical protein O6H91_01G176800 [Diphasiastrum complanatum]|uniref:Uncharacterized protein n=1 Tax=Diphasiastrum complanatum TaxID=34168 RepID=A0ACC2EZ71_DIPCM|nr:hypothetical protein O6H91_01G176800 [Diphasiastrum complanatum]
MSRHQHLSTTHWLFFSIVVVEPSSLFQEFLFGYMCQASTFFHIHSCLLDLLCS